MIYAQPNFAMPQPQYQPRPVMPQPQQAAPRPATAWQPPPQPAVARGVAPETPAKFVLPRPEALGVSKDVKVAPVAPPTIDWKQIQARMERLGVIAYQKARLENGTIHVAMTLPGNIPVQAQGPTEAAALLAALQQAEARR